MSVIRVIPRLDIKGPNLVKGVHLEGLRVLGKAEHFANKYFQQGADEILYIDTVASLYGRENLLDIVRRSAENIFVPLTAGGGIRTIEDIRSLLRAGADKVAINTGAIHNPRLISESSRMFGAQCIVISICAKHRGKGEYEAWTDNARERSGKNVFDWACEAVNLGAGELLITCIDQEGTGKGYDIDLVRRVADAVPVPVIACGGAGSSQHCLGVVRDGHADALCAASIFHYCELEELQSREQYQEEGNVEFLKRSRDTMGFLKNRLHPINIPDLKVYMQSHGVSCRMLELTEDIKSEHCQKLMQ